MLHVAMLALAVSGGLVAWGFIRVVAGAPAESVAGLISWATLSAGVAGAVAVYLLVDRLADATELWFGRWTMAYMENRLKRTDIELRERVEIERRLQELRTIMARQE